MNKSSWLILATLCIAAQGGTIFLPGYPDKILVIDESTQKIVDTDLRAGCGEHAGAAGFGVALARRARRDRRRVVEPEPALGDRAQDDLGGEDLGRRRRRHRRVGVLGEQRRARIEVDQQRVGDARLQRGGAPGREAREQQQRGQRDEDGVTDHVEAREVRVA